MQKQCFGGSLHGADDAFCFQKCADIACNVGLQNDLVRAQDEEPEIDAGDPNIIRACWKLQRLLPMLLLLCSELLNLPILHVLGASCFFQAFVLLG